LTTDNRDFLYISSFEQDELRRYRVGEMDGTVVASGNRKGSDLRQFNAPHYIAMDRDHSIYVSDTENHRLMKWIEGEQQGTVSRVAWFIISEYLSIVSMIVLCVCAKK
jgi:hypothetical protein